MPQILMLSQRVLNSVALLSAGQNQTAICNPVVYLEATTQGDLAGHTTQWEQISGSPTVTLEIVDETHAYYLVPGVPGTDKVFRFYIDKGSVQEQYREVTIWTTPTSTGVVYYGAAESKREWSSNFLASSNRIIYDFPFLPLSDLKGEALFNPTNLLLLWPYPEGFYSNTVEDINVINQFNGFSVERWNTNTWVVDELIGTNDPFESTFSIGDRVRLGVRYDLGSQGGNEAIAYSQWFDVDPDVIVCHEQGAQFDTCGASDATIQRIVLKVSELSYDDNGLVYNASGENFSTITRISYKVDEILNSGTAPIFSTFGNTTSTVTRNSGGSGSIGG